MKALALSAIACALISTNADAVPTVTIAFESINRNVFVRTTVGTAPHWFLLDTGAKYSVVDLAVARSAGIELGERIGVTGGGKDTVAARMVKSGVVRVVGLEGLEQPLIVALPLGDLADASGHELAGILGSDFIGGFVVEIDYERHTLTLRDTTAYEYRGDGEALPITFNDAGHPQIKAQVLDGPGPPRDGTFVLDIGSGAALILDTPFVDAGGFLTTGRPTVPWIEGRGLGGGIEGVVGRVDAMRLGRWRIERPVTVFSRAVSGPFASAEAQGNIGAAILERFKVILDYPRKRIILEPNLRLTEPFEYNRTGLSLSSAGPDYRIIQVTAVADRSPAAEAGVRSGDRLVEIDGRPASDFTLSQIRFMFKDAKRCSLTIQRGNARLKRSLVLRRAV